MEVFKGPLYGSAITNSSNYHNMEQMNIKSMNLDTLNESSVEKNTNMSLGMAYVPWQTWSTVYNADEALQRGTIFPDLDMPFYGGKCGMRGDKA